MKKIFTLSILALALLGCQKGNGNGNKKDNTPTPSIITTTIDFSKLGLADGAVFTSTTKDGLVLSASKASGSNDPKYYDNGSAMRLYDKNALTVTGEQITEISFTYDTGKTGRMTANIGDFDNNDWSGEANEIIFTVTTGQRRIQLMSVTHFGIVDDDTPTPLGERTVQSIAEDIATTFGLSKNDIQYENGEAYISISFEGVTSLVGAIEEACLYLDEIDYLVFDEENGIEEAQWSDGEDGAFAYYEDVNYQTNKLVVELGAYLEGTDYIVQFVVYTEQ